MYVAMYITTINSFLRAGLPGKWTAIQLIHPYGLQDADIYLLDDVLSAVDATVGRWLLEYAICGLLAEKTRILCSHTRSVLFGRGLPVLCCKIFHACHRPKS